MKVSKLVTLFVMFCVLTTVCKKNKTEEDTGSGGGLINQVDSAKVDKTVSDFMTKYLFPELRLPSLKMAN